MTDYHPLIARAVATLERNTGEARRALYERARTALLAQLRGVTPKLDETEITRERLALEEAIRKVEAESARRQREPAAAAQSPADAAAAPPPPSPQAPPAPGRAATPAGAAQPRPDPRRTEAGARRVPMPPSAPLDLPQNLGRALPAGAAPRPAPAQRAQAPVLREDDDMLQIEPAVPVMPERRAGAGRNARPSRDPLSGIPAAHDLDRLEPDIVEEDLRDPGMVEPAPELSNDPISSPAAMRPRSPRVSLNQEQLRRFLALPTGAIIKVAISSAIVIALCALVYWQRGTIAGIYQAMRGPSIQASRDVAGSQARPKISDRIGTAAPTTVPQAGTGPAVAQRVVLYEEEANDPQGRRYLGSVIWRTETVSPGPSLPPDVVVRADVEIPERRIAMTFSLRRNTDQNLPASHTVEIMFNLPADFPAGGIANVPGILMKQAEQTRGVPLAGLAVKVTTNFFLIGLSAVETDFQRNVALLKERTWFDVPVVYNNNRRAILAIEKGTPGERAFAEAFAAWRQ